MRWKKCNLYEESNVQKRTQEKERKKLVKTRNDENESNEGEKNMVENHYLLEKRKKKTTKEAYGYYTSTE